MDSREMFELSFERCRADSEFFVRFYHLFMSVEPRLKKMFSATDMGEQIKMLNAAMLMLSNADENPPVSLLVKQLAHRHDERGIRLTPGDIDIWLHCLLLAVEDTDPLFNEQIAAAWKDTLAFGLESLKNQCMPVEGNGRD